MIGFAWVLLLLFVVVCVVFQSSYQLTSIYGPVSDQRCPVPLTGP